MQCQQQRSQRKPQEQIKPGIKYSKRLKGKDHKNTDLGFGEVEITSELKRIKFIDSWKWKL